MYIYIYIYTYSARGARACSPKAGTSGNQPALSTVKTKSRQRVATAPASTDPFTRAHDIRIRIHTFADVSADSMLSLCLSLSLYLSIYLSIYLPI